MNTPFSSVARLRRLPKKKNTDSDAEDRFKLGRAVACARLRNNADTVGVWENRGVGERGGKALGAALGLRVEHALPGSEAQSTATMANESLHRRRVALRAFCSGVRRSFMLWGGACSACSCSKEPVRVSLAGRALGNLVRQ